ncbi:type 4 pilus major pilin [Bordetella sp. FB-8]|uniref:type 4 pilus major pilin n=1 Tax=Bordetella sp. FB-8 TaxID=1159870 RepID=UPI0009DA1721|nr:type 4 pilus major pilin [Bordetella sp. FB-8]
MKISNQKALHAQRGFWIGPALGTLAVVLVLVVFGSGIFRFLSNQYTIYTEFNNLKSVVTGADALELGGSYASVNNAALQTSEAFGNMTGAAVGGTVINKWGGPVTVTGTASNVQITWGAVPPSACSGFLARAADSKLFDTASMPTCNGTGNTDLTFTHY